MMKLRACQRGFTLIELLVVIGIAAILAAAFLPGLDRLQTRPSLEAALRQLESVIVSSRSDARALQNNSFRLNVANGAISLFQVVGLPVACPGTINWGTAVQIHRFEGVNVGGAAMPTDLCFNSNGLILTDNNADPVRYEMTRRTTERAYRLTLWPTSGGLIREQRANSAAAWELLP